MAIEQFPQRFGGMRQDVTISKDTGDKYFSARNVRITATDQPSKYSLTNEHGNEFVLSIPTPFFNLPNTSIDYNTATEVKHLPYVTTNSGTTLRCQLEIEFEGKFSGQQKIIGVKEARNSIIIISTDDNGFDCFWELTGLNSENFDIELLYMNNLELSSNNLCQIIYNYENSIIEKMYFADGINQLRFVNLRQSTNNGDLLNLADLNPASIDTVSTFELSQPSVTAVVGGGSHTSGKVQYAYGLYVLNGSQTTISPLSELVPIDKGDGLGGGKVNEDLGKSVLLSIPSIDTNYTHIKVYAIKYTSFNQAPSVSIIEDKEIDNFDSMDVYDTGSATNQTISLEQFIFLGSSPKIPKHLATKDSRMFLINLKEKNFSIDLDMRAYGHNSGGNSIVWENLTSNGTTVTGSQTTINTATYALPKKHDAINKDYNLYKYQANGSTLGGEGIYLKYELTQLPADASSNQFFKDNEIYRLGIQFYNSRGQKSDPIWVSDFVAPEGNLEGNYNQLKVDLKPAFTTWLNDESNFIDSYAKPIGYRIIRADRQLSDKTIVAQGLINPMVSNYQDSAKKTGLSERKSRATSNSSSKMPSLIRVFEDKRPFVQCKNYHELAWQNATDSKFDQLGDKGYKTSGSINDAYRGNECYKSPSSSDWKAQTFQFNQLMQMFSPEVSFTDVSLDSSLKLDIRGMHKSSKNSSWSAEVEVPNGDAEVEAKFEGGFTRTSSTSHNSIKGKVDHLNDRSIFGPANHKSYTSFNQYYRAFEGGFIKNNGIREHVLFGTPEMTERGAGWTNYNGNAEFRYANNLQALLQDDFRNSKNGHIDGDDAKIAVIGSNSYGERNITFAEGSVLDDSKSIEQMKSESGISHNDGVLIAELKKPDDQRYVGSSYGGFSYESKVSASYMPIGDYKEISSTSVSISSPGDTFVQVFKFIKLNKTDTLLGNRSQTQVTEIVSVPVETSIDLDNRDDLSLEEWDNKFHPSHAEYTEYNRVYSQQPTLVKNTSKGFKFKQVSEFDTRIIASKEKIAGENIDSWSDFLENERIDLDGKYGPINAVVNWNDEIFTLQDTGVARIAVNPRVQTSGADGISIELGTGKVLHDYQYISGKSGSLNKWGVVATEKGFYWVDLLQKSIMASYGTNVINLSDTEGLHTLFQDNIAYEDYVADLPNKNMGISTGFHSPTKDVFFTFKSANKSFTINYNENVTEQRGAFVSLLDFTPAFYIGKGSVLMTTNEANTAFWQHFKGNKCQFYGAYYPSSIEFTPRSPKSSGQYMGGKVVFNNVEWKSLVQGSTGKELIKTMSTIQVRNDYQDTGVKALVQRENIRRRERSWMCQIPRHAGSRDRISSPWCYMELVFTNANNESLILHDINILYTQY